MRRTLKRFLRSPRVIVGELLALALLCSLGAALPQIGTATPAELARLRDGSPLTTACIRLFALDHIFHSNGFLALTGLACASLAVIVFQQATRLRSQWSQRLTQAHFRSAPFQTEFTRAPAAGEPHPQITAAGNRQRIWTERRAGLLGSPLVHFGLLLVILAGVLRGLFGTEAVVDLVEGETLPPTAAAWAGQRAGALGRAFRLDCPVTLRAVRSAHYPDGDLRDLRVELSLERPQGSEPAVLAVNHDLKTSGGRIFLASDFGPAALVEWRRATAAPLREAVLLARRAGGAFEGVASGPDGVRAYLRARLGANGAPAGPIEVRVMKEGALLFAGAARAGQILAWRASEGLALHGLPSWVRLRGSRDPALGLAFLGFALVLVGAALVFAVVKVDTCVAVTPEGEAERVFVALRPQRFAPLFQERFEQLVRESAAGIMPGDGVDRPVGAKRAARRLAVPAPRLAMWSILLLLALPLSGCRPVSAQDARRLVERYNRVVAEAYRRGDVTLIDPLVGPQEGRKLTGLIGVRLDLGITLDAQLLALEVAGVEATKDELRVATRERWRYCDRRIGTGERVGEESLDAYEMLYLFKRTGQIWRVEEIRFTAPPRVGRKQTPWLAERRAPTGIGTGTNEGKVELP